MKRKLQLSILLVSIFTSRVLAQTTITTTFTNNAGDQVVVFNFQNTNTYDVDINSISTTAGSGGLQTASLWVKNSPTNPPGIPSAISHANGWSQITSAVVSTTTNTTGSGSTAQLMLSGMNYRVPAGTSVRLCMSLSNAIRYSTVGAQTSTFTAGGCSIICGTGYGYSGTLAAPITASSGFIGKITFQQTPPCTAGNILSNTSVACPNSTFNLSLQNNTSGAGISYQWRSSSDNSIYSDIAGATSTSYSSTQSVNTFYECVVACVTGGGRTDTTNPVLINTPAPGNTVATANPVCPGTNFTLSLSNSLPVSGLIYQWQKSSDSLSWATITGVSSNTYTTTITSSTYFKCIITCTNGGTPVTSTPLLVSASFLNCYCHPNIANGCMNYDDVTILRVQFNSLYNSSGCTGLPFYTSYPASGNTTTSVSQLDVVSLSVSPFFYPVYAWIDWDHSGSFDASEIILIGPDNTPPAQRVQTFTTQVTIPGNALTGQTKMRIFTGAAPSDPCNSPGGEAEDYIITINPPQSVPCTAPIAGTANVNPPAGCPTEIRSIILSGNSNGTAQTYQWQSSQDNITYTNIIGATQSEYNSSVNIPTYFRCRVTCNEQTSTSAEALATVNNFLTCYCSSIGSISPSGFNNTMITRVKLNGIESPYLEPTNYYHQGYRNYNSGTPTWTLYKGMSCSFDVLDTTQPTIYGPSYDDYASIYIDFNHDGAFNETTEKVYHTDYPYPIPQHFTGTFIPPQGSITGATLMRIICGNKLTETFAGDEPSPCGYYDFGETEDYLINILPVPPLTLNLKMYLEGFYSNRGLVPVLYNAGISADPTACDSVIIELHYPTYPYGVAFTNSAIVNVSGNVSITYPAAAINSSYYIVVKHRNSIETWSKQPVMLGLITNFDYTSP